MRGLVRTDKFLNALRFGGNRLWREDAVWGHHYLVRVPVTPDASRLVEVNLPEVFTFPARPEPGEPATFPFRGDDTFTCFDAGVPREGRRFTSSGEVVFRPDPRALVRVSRTIDLELPVPGSPTPLRIRREETLSVLE